MSESGAKLNKLRELIRECSDISIELIRRDELNDEFLQRLADVPGMLLKIERIIK